MPPIAGATATFEPPLRRDLTAKVSYYTLKTWVSPMYQHDYAGPTAVDRPVTCGFSSTREQSIRCFPRKSGGPYGLKLSARWNSRWQTARRSSVVFPSADLKSEDRK